MSNQDQLSKVVAAFEQWRETRVNGKNATPKPLRKKAVALKSHELKKRKRVKFFDR